MHVRHELLAGDFPRRLHFSEWFNQHCRREKILDSFIIGDEAGFSLNGEVKTHNVRQYAPKGQPPAFNFEAMIPCKILLSGHHSAAMVCLWDLIFLPKCERNCLSQNA
jgi:hypothetical protein